MFTHNYPTRAAEVREAITRGEDKRPERAAHILKGEVGLFGALTAYHLADTLETMGSEAHPESVPHILQDLERELEQGISFLDQVAWNTRVWRHRSRMLHGHWGGSSDIRVLPRGPTRALVGATSGGVYLWDAASHVLIPQPGMGEGSCRQHWRTRGVQAYSAALRLARRVHSGEVAQIAEACGRLENAPGHLTSVLPLLAKEVVP